MLDVFEVELLGPDEGQDTAGGSHHDVRAVALQDLLVFGNGQTAEKHAVLEVKNKLWKVVVCSRGVIG